MRACSGAYAKKKTIFKYLVLPGAQDILSTVESGPAAQEPAAEPEPEVELDQRPAQFLAAAAALKARLLWSMCRVQGLLTGCTLLALSSPGQA